MSDAAAAILTNLFGSDRVIAGAALTVRPATVDDLCRAVKLLTDLGVAIVPRSGRDGAAETGDIAGAVAILDLSDLNRVIEINEPDRTVTVEAGCSWGELRSALTPLGLRTPFYGPLADGAASIGASASGNSWFFGSGAYGTAADHVLSLDVVLADGSLVQTGAAAGEGRAPFFRHFGPDFTGLFLGDSGAFGVKARVTMPLIPLPAAEAYASFAFERFEDIAEAHVALAREHIVAEQWGLDPESNDALAARGHKFLEGVTFAHDPSPEWVARANERLTVGHRQTLRGGFSLHVAVEATTEREAETKLGRVRRLMLPIALKELPNAIPQLVRANPFRAAGLLFAAAGEHHVSLHGLFPFSKASTIVAVTDEYFLRHHEVIAKRGIRHCCLTGTVGNAFLLAPVISWSDPSGREDALRLRRDLIGLWDAFGATHLQMGRLYPYTSGLSSAARAMAETVKRALDPRGLMNPGVLQLGAAPAAKAIRKFAEFPQNLLEEN